MSDIISMHRADLVDAVTEAVKPLKARIDSLEAELAAEKMQHSVTIAEEHESRSEFQDRLGALEAALRTYGGHQRGCVIERAPPWCSCGWIETFPKAMGATELETACEHDFATYFINNAKFPSDPPSVTSWVKCRKCGTYPRDANV